MDLESLAQDVSDKTLPVLDRQVALSEAKLALSEALCESGVPSYKQVAIALLHHVVVCKWDRVGREYKMTFVPKVPNANA